MSHALLRLVLAAVLLFGFAGAAVAQTEGHVAGQVVDADGKAVTDLTLRFTSQDGQDRVETIATRKKGRFFHRGLPRGSYRVDLVDSDLFVTHLEFQLRNKDGLTVGEGRIDGDPRNGVSGVRLTDQHEVKLTLVVAPKGSTAARERELAVAFPGLNAAAELYNSGQYEQAAEEAKRTLADHPDLGEALYVRGVALGKVGRHAEAEAALRQAIERIPDHPGIWAQLGEMSMKLGAEHATQENDLEARQAYGRAAEALTEAVERNPGSMPLQLNLAASLDRAGDHDRLLNVLERVVEQEPTKLESRLRLASLHSSQGRHDRAMDLVREIPTTDKRAAVTLYNIAVGLHDDGDTEGSLLVARRSTEIDPQLSHPKRLIAQILLAKDERPAAIDAIRSFLEVAADDSEAETYRRILEQLEKE